VIAQEIDERRPVDVDGPAPAERRPDLDGPSPILQAREQLRVGGLEAERLQLRERAGLPGAVARYPAHAVGAVAAEDDAIVERRRPQSRQVRINRSRVAGAGVDALGRRDADPDRVIVDVDGA
jgi:hypothetical protein